MKKQLVYILLSLLLFFGSGNKAFSQWISPGTLAKAHKELSGVTSCLKCHSLAQGLDNMSCNSCHEELKKKIKDNKGLHARIKSDCITCHTDHKGAAYDITSIDENSFNHSLTGYELKDGHIMTCINCHKKEDTYMGNSSECLSCHADLHKKTAPEDCIQCHNYKEWKDYAFDHSINAEFKLIGKHGDAKCELCHPRNTVNVKAGDKEKEYQVMKFKPIQSETCRDCHNDVHKKQFEGQVCDSCHSLEKGWKEYTFKHDSETYRGFTLEGKHKEVECEKCHKRGEISYTEFESQKKVQVGLFKPLKSETCSDCHFDVHKDQFKDQRCDSCHSVEKEWKDKTFSHETRKYEGYKLEGKHKEVECEKCHKRGEISYTEFESQKKVQVGLFKPLKSETCSDCHFDVHKDQFKDQRCDSCHSVEKEWKDRTFSHETRKYEGYKLEGKHKEVECEKCHKRGEISYTEFESQKKVQVGLFKPLKSETCSDCHKDGHEGKFDELDQIEGVTCSDCHSVEKEFKDHVYTHKEDSNYHKYNRDGQVKESDCAACHYCEKNVFSVSKCFEQMGLMPR